MNMKYITTASSIREEIENSPRRLQTDYVDLYQIRWPIPEEVYKRLGSTQGDFMLQFDHIPATRNAESQRNIVIVSPI